jgi:hypothetical protein
MVRIYLPATFPLLSEWLDAGQATGSGPAYAVTPALREWYREADVDELEHATQVAASIGSLELLAVDVGSARRRVVVAADVDELIVTPDPQRGRAVVRLAGPVPIACWSSALIDDPAAEPVIVAAIAALAQAGSDDSDAQFAVDEAEATDLGWYAVQELRHLFP